MPLTRNMHVAQSFMRSFTEEDTTLAYYTLQQGDRRMQLNHMQVNRSLEQFKIRLKDGRYSFEFTITAVRFGQARFSKPIATYYLYDTHRRSTRMQYSK